MISLPSSAFCVGYTASSCSATCSSSLQKRGARGNQKGAGRQVARKGQLATCVPIFVVSMPSNKPWLPPGHPLPPWLPAQHSPHSLLSISVLRGLAPQARLDCKHVTAQRGGQALVSHLVQLQQGGVGGEWQ